MQTLFVFPQTKLLDHIIRQVKTLGFIRYFLKDSQEAQMLALVHIGQVEKLGFLLVLIHDFLLFFNIHIFIQKLNKLVGTDIILKGLKNRLSRNVAYDHIGKHIHNRAKMF